VYADLGMRRVINAAATLTRLGGSIMPPPVLEAMMQASRSFVELPELQRRCGERLARITKNEAAYVCCGAAAGLTLTTAACITGTDPARIARLPGDLAGLKDEVVVHRSQRNGYDFAIRQTGVRMVEIGPSVEELEAAIGDRTAAVAYFAGRLAHGSLPLKTVVEVAHRRGVPVIVDGAAQIPPISNLWQYTVEDGADLAVFSGGKGLRGPQSSGLIVGRADLIEAVRMHGPPNQAIGRPMKVGKEEMVGLVAAVEWYLSLDEPSLVKRYERQVARVVEAVAGIAGVTASREFPSEAGQPMPRALVRFDAAVLGFDRDEVVRRLREGDPYVEVSGGGDDAIYVNPQTLDDGEEAIVVERLVAALKRGR
jgi:L-seryl-tRNA(Ser) seleniumtransferase